MHCTAGKDRTGVLTMVLLSLAGCSADTIAEEYHLSEIGLGLAWRADAVSRLRQNPVFRGKNEDGIERMVGARKEVMKAVIELVTQEWGSVEGFLKYELEVDDLVVSNCKKVLGNDQKGLF